MSRYINPVPQITKILNGTVVPIVGAKLFFFDPGTTTKKTIYSDSSFTTPRSNPVLSDVDGRYSDDIFLDGVYRVVQQDDSGTVTGFDGVTIWTKDPVGEVEAGQFDPWTNDATYNIPDIVEGSDNEYYRSIIDNNQGNDPTSTPSAWEELELGRIWNTNVTYSSGETVYGSDGLKYISRIDSNTGNDPITDDSNWRLLNDEPNLINNVSFAAAVATKALTIDLKTGDGSDPTTTDKCILAFRNSTLTSGIYEIKSVTSALTLTAPSGATLGFGASATDFLYVYALNNAGAVELALCGEILDEKVLHSSTAISATADADNVLYSTTARSNVAVRLIGRIKIQTGAVAGEWDNSPTELYVGNPPISLRSGEYIKLSDVKATTVAGGSSVAGTQTRVLNTIDTDTGSHVSLASNQFTLDAGTWRIKAKVPAYRVDAHKAFLYNATDTANTIIGTSAYSSSTSGAVTHSFVEDEFTITTSKTFEIQHYTQSVQATNGLGFPTSDSTSEIYTIVELTKVK